mmetsp:Transcript_29270/g.62216  ORF Transcript_29270/g.62216 Transcript_29270/m.62216 type:complete len:366 (-) Transcript_29270:12-1109(-)
MAKLFNIRPRWRNLLLVRALLFAISVALSSSGEDVEPFDTTDRILSAPRRLGQASSDAIEPLLEQDSRMLHSKSATSKSSKSGSKSGSNGSKSKSAKSGSKSGSKGSKSKSSKSGSKSNSKGSKSKSGKNESAKGKSVSSSKSKSDERSSKSKSSTSIYSRESEEIPHTSIEISSSDTDSENTSLPTEDEPSVATQSTSAETNSVHYDSMDVDGNSDNQSVSSSVSSHNSYTEDMEATGTTRPDATPPSLDGAEINDMDMTAIENEAIAKTANLEGDFMDEKIEESNNGINDDEDSDAHSAHGSFSSNNSLSQAEIEETSSASSEVGASSDESMMETTTLEAGFIEERIEENESIEDLDEREAVE